MTTQNFFVNLDLRNSDVIELKQMILDFLRAKVEERVVKHYRVESMGKVTTFLAIDKSHKIKDPTSDRINELLGFLKDVKPTPDGMKDQILMNILFPI